MAHFLLKLTLTLTFCLFHVTGLSLEVVLPMTTLTKVLTLNRTTVTSVHGLVFSEIPSSNVPFSSDSFVWGKKRQELDIL